MSTQSPEVPPTTVAPARPRAGRARPLSIVRQVAVVAVPVLLGALVGFLLAVVPAASYRAVALVDAGPSASVADSLNVSPEVANRFVQTELLYIEIDEPAVSKEITAQLGISDPPSVAARQIGSTNVVELAVQAPTQQQAADAANIAAEVYATGWKERAGADLERALATVNTRITQVTAQLSALPAAGGTPAEAAQRDALTAELTRLTQQQASLLFESGAVKSSDRLVSKAEAAAAVKTSSVSRNVLLGALLGLLVGVGVLVLLRRRATGPDPDAWNG